MEPIVAGLEGEDNKPFICGMDLIGAPVFAKDFCVAGTAEDELFGTAESMYKPDLVSFAVSGNPVFVSSP